MNVTCRGILSSRCRHRLVPLICPWAGQPCANLWTNKKKFISKNKADGVESQSYLVYSNSNRSLIYSSLAATSVAVPPALLVVAGNIYQNIDKMPAVLLSIDEPVLPSIILTSFGIFLAESIRRIFTRAASKIYYNDETNVFTLVPLRLVGRSENVSFTPADVSWRTKLGLLAQTTGNLFIKGKLYYITAGDFKDSSYHSMMTAAANRKLP